MSKILIFVKKNTIFLKSRPKTLDFLEMTFIITFYHRKNGHINVKKTTTV